MHWSNSAGQTKVGPFPATLIVGPTLLFLMHIRYWTAGTAILTVLVLFWLHHRGKSITWLVRRWMSKWRGETLQARPLHIRNRFRILLSLDELDLKSLRGKK